MYEKVYWPESQRFMEDEYEQYFESGEMEWGDDMSVYIDKDLYEELVVKVEK